MGHGHPHRVGRDAVLREIFKGIGRDLQAVRLAVRGVCIHQCFPVQICLRLGVALIELDGELECFPIHKMPGIGAPDHRGGGVLPGHDGGGVGGDIQRRGVARNHGVGDGVRPVVRILIIGAVVGGEGEGHRTHLLARGRNRGLQRITFNSSDGGDVGIAALPCAGGGRGSLAACACECGGEGGPVFLAQGQLRDARLIRRDGDAVHVHIGGDGEAVVKPGGIHPIGLVLCAHVDLEDGRVGGVLLLPGDGQRVSGKGGCSALSDDLYLSGVGLSAVLHHHPEGGSLTIVIVGNGIVKGGIHVYGKGDAGGGVVFAGGEAGGGKPEDQALQRHALNLGVEAGPITEHIGNAADAGDGQFFVVALLYRVPRQQGGARGVAHPEVGGGEVLAVDVHHRAALIHLHQLVELQQDGYPLAGAVGAFRGGGGDGGGVVVIGEGDGLRVVDGDVNRSVIVSVLSHHIDLLQGDIGGNWEALRAGRCDIDVDIIRIMRPHEIRVAAPFRALFAVIADC